MNKRELRKSRLLADLTKNPTFSVSQLAKKYCVSEMTIRRDLSTIDMNHLIPITKTVSNYDFILENTKNIKNKEAIAQTALALIEAEDTIIFDAGTTNTFIASHLPADIPLTIITHSYPIMAQVHNMTNVQLIFIGGYYHQNTQSFESEESINFLKTLRAKKFFLSASGVDTNLGITCSNQYEVSFKRVALASSQKKILVCDSEKFDTIKSSFITTLDDIDMIITDNDLSYKWRNFLFKKSTNYKIAE